MSKEYELKGYTYLIGSFDPIVGSRLAFLYMRNRAALSETDFAWVQTKALSVVSRYEERGGVRAPLPVYANGQIVPLDLRTDTVAVIMLVERALNWGVLDDFFAAGGIDLLMPDYLKEQAKKAELTE